MGVQESRMCPKMRVVQVLIQAAAGVVVVSDAVDRLAVLGVVGLVVESAAVAQKADVEAVVVMMAVMVEVATGAEVVAVMIELRLYILLAYISQHIF